jgi:DNA-binding CsgD family transcriptional regulator
VLHVNDLCRQLLDNGLSIRHKRLRAENAKQDAQLAHLIQWACDGTRQNALLPHPSVATLTGNPAHSLIVSAAPVHRTAGDVFGFEGAILFLTPLARNIIVSETMLESLFCLTPREAQIMSMVGSGEAVDAIAKRLAISREAVRFHLKGIFAKTASHRQSDIVALCCKLEAESGR